MSRPRWTTSTLVFVAIVLALLFLPAFLRFLVVWVRRTRTTMKRRSTGKNGRAKLRMSVPAGMMEPAFLRHLPPGTPTSWPGRRGTGKEVRAVSKPRGRHAKVHRGKGTARKVSDVLNSIARPIRAVGVLVDALSKWIG